MEKLCGANCSMPNCYNRVRTDLVRIGDSGMLPGERGLFAMSAVPTDTPIADFGPVRELRQGEKGKDTELGYSIPISEGGSLRKWVTPLEGVKGRFVAHAINHTCDPRFQNCGLVHTGEKGETRDGLVKVKVYVKTIRRVEPNEEFFMNYGSAYTFDQCQCHVHRTHVGGV